MGNAESESLVDPHDELEERKRVAEAAGVSVPPEQALGGEVERPGVGAGDVLDGVVTTIVGVDLVADLIGAIPDIAHESLEVIGNIGEALGDVLDFDF